MGLVRVGEVQAGRQGEEKGTAWTFRADVQRAEARLRKGRTAESVLGKA